MVLWNSVSFESSSVGKGKGGDDMRLKELWKGVTRKEFRSLTMCLGMPTSKAKLRMPEH